MILSSGPLRRRLILLLTIVLAVGFYPALAINQSEAAGYGRSQPSLYDESPFAVIETAAECDQAESSAGSGRQSGLASSAASILLQASSARLPSRNGLLLHANRLALFPNKTGPPSL